MKMVNVHREGQRAAKIEAVGLESLSSLQQKGLITTQLSVQPKCLWMERFLLNEWMQLPNWQGLIQSEMRGPSMLWRIGYSPCVPSCQPQSFLVWLGHPDMREPGCGRNPVIDNVTRELSLRYFPPWSAFLSWGQRSTGPGRPLRWQPAFFPSEESDDTAS